MPPWHCVRLIIDDRCRAIYREAGLPSDLLLLAFHHGTPDERGAAIVRGFEASYNEGKSLGEAIEESTRYVLSL
jgi:hypothetical protein